MDKNRSDRRPGMILLVVLGMLTFFSILVATYLVFSSQSRQSSFVIAARNTKTADVRGLMDEALLTLIRGTDDETDPFYGEDLLSDYYGRFDALSLRVRPLPTATYTTSVSHGFARFPIILPSTAPWGMADSDPWTVDPEWRLDDLFTGRVITFRGGDLVNRSFRVIRSRYIEDPGAMPPVPGHIALYIELPADLFPDTLIASLTAAELDDMVRDLFYTTANVRVHMNGVPRNSPGIGFDGTEINRNAPAQVGLPGGIVGFTLPAALQPNHLGRAVEKVARNATTGIPTAERGDFDESYDASDFNNWFLSYRDADGKVTPSFHRPAVINYILSEEIGGQPFGTAFTDEINRQNAILSVARATFRPLPIFNLNSRFTGSNEHFILRTPINLTGDEAAARFKMNQLMRALIGVGPGVRDLNPWDVDNVGDGVPDSIWIDLNLPIIVSREGKLLKPLIAPMIEDLSGRININAHDNYEIVTGTNQGGVQGRAYWANSRTTFDDTTSPNDKRVFRGIGYGPADIRIPLISNSGVITNTDIQANLRGLINARYQFGGRGDETTPMPGRNGQDDLDVVRSSARPPLHSATAGYGYSVDPFGRGAMGIGRGGQIVVARAGQTTSTSGNESIDDPYEMDPTGRLSGDRPFTFDELEPILRSNAFDHELLPDRLRSRLQLLFETHAEFEHALTTASVSDDSIGVAAMITKSQQSLQRLMIELLINVTNNASLPAGDPLKLTEDQVRQMARDLIAPELRLGRKIDVNRPFGNGVDDDGDDIIDEPGETETEAFPQHPDVLQTIPGTYTGQAPNYNFGQPVNGRQLLARHLYVLMMALTRNAEFPGVDHTNPITNTNEQHLYRARRIAQWAVNVVDYRDPDSIMTRFVYDPFVLGNSTRPPGWNPPPEPAPPGVVVWGVEQPEMVFSESLALHDVRLRDTNRDSTNRRKIPTTAPIDAGDVGDWDSTTDQVRIPQGSLFLELHSTRPPIDATGNDERTKAALPRELYKYPGGATTGTASTLGLDLAARNLQGVPVWRIAISEPHRDPSLPAIPADFSNVNPDPIDPAQQRLARPNSASFQPEWTDELTGAPPVPLDRFIMFRHFADQDAVKLVTDLVTDMNGRDNRVFFPSQNAANTDVLLSPGKYLTLAPRDITHLGSEAFPNGSAPVRPSRQRLQVNSGLGGLIHYNVDDSQLTPTLNNSTGSFATADALVISTFAPNAPNWNTVFGTNFVGLNVSEPLPRAPIAGGPVNYYPLPTERYSGGSNGDYPRTDAYVNLAGASNTALNSPLDPARNRIPRDQRNAEEPYLGVIPQYCSVFLQRLADPTQNYNVNTNPYRTVDWMSVDLTVFNGEDRENRVTHVVADFVADPTTIPAARQYHRRSRQRNGQLAGVQRDALFSYNTTEPELEGINTADPHYFAFGGPANIYGSFSFLNTNFVNVNPNVNGFSSSIGMSGAAGVVGYDRNLPLIPFAQHPWLNRPFATAYELMMVPACSQGRLFEEFSLPPTTGVERRVYSNGSPANNDAESVERFVGPFRHLFNFFHGDSSDTSSNSILRADFSRLFNFVNTLPRYRGEVEMIRPNRIVDNTLLEMHRPPFNFLYDNRRQGRINLNTVAEFPVWAGLMHGHLNPASIPTRGDTSQLGFDAFVRNRRGFDAETGTVAQIQAGSTINYDDTRYHSLFPTEFVNAYRGHADARFAPRPRLRSDLTPPDVELPRRLIRRGTEGGLLRRDAYPLGSKPTNTTPLSETPLFVRDRAEQPVPANTTTEDHTLNRERNAFIRYQTLMRMPNLVSDNSQLYCIRLTMGFFEVDAATQSLGREYNEDIGQNQRHQAMFIIDRSRPVGFVPGQNLNARDVVVFEKFYE